MSSFALGVAFIVAATLAGVGLFKKDYIATTFSPGETIQINFAGDYRLREYVTTVKVAGIRVGTVSDVERQDDGSAMVSVKVDNGVEDKLGSAPSATIRPTTLLGGSYYIDLVPGGDRGRRLDGVIPRDRTTTPVELDQVAGTLQPDAVAGIRSATDRLQRTLAGGGRTALDALADDAPAALAPAADVAGALRGTDPGPDLAGLVGGLETTARTLTENQGQLDAILADLATTSRTLGNRSQDLAAALSAMPETLRSTDAGLDRLRTTLGKLRDTAGPLRPVVRELDTLAGHANPVLADALLVVRDLKGVLADARPLVQQLVPVTRQGSAVLDDLRGPVLDRVNGPVKNMVLSPFKGEGPYAGTGTGRPFYEELAFMVANIDRASKMTDGNGSSVGFQPGFGAGTLAGLPISLEQLWRGLANLPNPDTKEGQ